MNTVCIKISEIVSIRPYIIDDILFNRIFVMQGEDYTCVGSIMFNVDNTVTFRLSDQEFGDHLDKLQKAKTLKELRDKFAIAAMQGLATSGNPRITAELAYQLADYMILEREKI